MSQVYLEIGDLDTLMAFLRDAQKAGLLIGVSPYKVEHSFSEKDFPVRIPVNLDAVLAVAGNPIVKKVFGKTIETKTVDILNKALRGQA